MAGRQWKRLLALLAMAGLAVGGFAAWQRYSHKPATPAASPPEIPEVIVDPEVVSALTAARDRVLADSRSVSAWGELGVLFRAHKFLPQADACFAEAAKLDPDNPRWPYLIGLDNLLLFTGDAVRHFRQAYSIATQPEERSVARLQLAEALIEQNELDEAGKLFAEELSLLPDNPRALFGLGVLAITRNDDAAAVEYLTRAAGSPYYRHKAATLLVAVHKRLGNAALADRFAKVITLPPADEPWPDPFDSGLSTQQLGQAARQHSVAVVGSKGRIEDVVAFLDEIARSHPDDPTQIPRAVHLLKLGDFAGAEKACREALAIDPKHASGRCFLGVSLYFQALDKWNENNREAAKKLFEASLAELKKGIELKPDLGYAHLHMGYDLKYLGQLPEAGAAFRMAIQVSPHDPNAHLALGELLIEMNKTPEAIPHLEDAARLSQPNDKRARAKLEEIRSKKL